MKRSRLKPGEPLKAKKSLERKGTLKRVGKRKSREIEQFYDFRKNWLKEHPWCQICPILATVGIVINDQPLHRAEGLHERQKRSQGGKLDQPANLLSACNASNGLIETMPKKARELGLVVYSWEDPESVDIAWPE